MEQFVYCLKRALQLCRGNMINFSQSYSQAEAEWQSGANVSSIQIQYEEESSEDIYE